MMQAEVAPNITQASGGGTATFVSLAGHLSIMEVGCVCTES